MSGWAQGPGWWQASDRRWYPPESHPNAQRPPPPVGGPHEQGPSHTARRRTVLFSVTGAAVIVVVILVLVLLLMPTSKPRRTVATFVPVSSTASAHQLAEDANQLSRRLDSLNDQSDSVVIRGRTITVLGQTPLPIPGPTLIESGTLQFRPALCLSNPYGTAPVTNTTLGPVPGACSGPQYSLRAPTLVVNTSTGNSNIDSIPLDPVLTPYKSSTPVYNDANPNKPVLIPLDGGGGERYLLGPSELSGIAVAATQAAYQAPNWVVNVTLTQSGASAWDALADKYFHEIIGLDLDGRIVSAPLTQPAESTFTSFDGKVQISGDFSKRSAQELAANLASGPLAAPLRVQHQ
jgi:SecD-like export protein